MSDERSGTRETLPICGWGHLSILLIERVNISRLPNAPAEQDDSPAAMPQEHARMCPLGHKKDWKREMTEVSHLESRYDAFLFASLCQDDELPLSVLSVLTRQDLDPWQEADRLAHLSNEQAVNSLASRIWKSDSKRWSPSEASVLAIRLIQLLPSHDGSTSDRNSEGAVSRY